MAGNTKGSHCTFCGARFTEQVNWPRKCFVCYNDSFKNSVPVVVMIVPVWGQGYLIQQRGIDPKKGGWSFPGGYIDFGEEWQEAAVRELKEEMGLNSSPEQFKMLEVRNDGEGHMLIFCNHPGFTAYDVQQAFEPNAEVMAYEILSEDNQREICFPLHKEVFSKYYW